MNAEGVKKGHEGTLKGIVPNFSFVRVLYEEYIRSAAVYTVRFLHKSQVFIEDI